MTKKRQSDSKENIKLPTAPLIEAWLEVQWKLEDDPNNPNTKNDPGFEFAALNFSQKVKSEFPTKIALENSRIPIDIAPYLVRFQFRKGTDGWPLFQIGPGIATVNFTTSYNWTDFSKYAEILREQVVSSYENVPETKLLLLRYRNAIIFDYTKDNLINFFRDNLNLSLSWPSTIPGNLEGSRPPQATFQLHFTLKEDIGIGRIIILLGKKKEENKETNIIEEKEAIVVDIGVETVKPPDLQNKDAFMTWLDSAHTICEEWFLSLVDGPLLERYREK